MVLEKEFEIKRDLNNYLRILRTQLKNKKYIENTFVEIFGPEYLLNFDEFDFELEKLILEFCKWNKIYLLKTHISYIFSFKKLIPKRKYDKVLI